MYATESTKASAVEAIKRLILNYEQFIDHIMPSLNISNAEKKLLLTISISSLDFVSVMKAYLKMPSDNRWWEGVAMFKYLYLLISESHSKIGYRIMYKDDGRIDEGKTNSNIRKSLWYSGIKNRCSQMTPAQIEEYNKITEELTKFREETDWKFVTKIRNRAGHYSDINTYINDMQLVEINSVIDLCEKWFLIISNMKTFIVDHSLFPLKTTTQQED